MRKSCNLVHFSTKIADFQTSGRLKNEHEYELYRMVTYRYVSLRISGQKFPWSSADFFVNLQQEKE